MIIGTVLVALLFGGLTVGVVALVRAGVAREESDRSLLADPPTRAAAITRRAVGLYVRTPELSAQPEFRAIGGSP